MAGHSHGGGADAAPSRAGGHAHGHSHGHGMSAAGRHRPRLVAAVALIGGFFVVELVTGLVSGSLALLSDAGHMAADVLTLAAALGASILAARPDASGRRTYGRYRLEVFASGLAVLVMLAVSAYVIIEGLLRIGAEQTPASAPMMIVGALGLLVNLVVMLLLREGASESLNLRGAYLEVVADTVGSIGVILAGAVIAVTGYGLADTIVALAVGAFVAVRAVMLGREVLAVLGQSVPAGLDPAAVRGDLAALDGVQDVHDLHLWSLTSGMEVASAHLVLAPGAGHHGVLDSAQEMLTCRYGIEHATLQVEPADHSVCHDLAW